MFWRLHTAIFSEQIDNAEKIIKSFNDEVQIVTGTPSQLMPVPYKIIDMPVLAITTLQDANRLIRQDYPSTPWLFFNNKNYEVTYWLPRIGEDIPVLNRNAIFLPVGLLKNSIKALKSISNKNKMIFIKPNSGNKIFTGFSCEITENYQANIENYLKFSSIEPETLCCISEHVELEEIEWRFWIAERKIIAFSPYSWNENPPLYAPPKDVFELAEKMTKNPWQPDYVYVVDFCITQNGKAMLLEINAASTSGVYEANLNDLLIGIRNTSTREWEGNIDD
jgi:hypothetical protein